MKTKPANAGLRNEPQITGHKLLDDGPGDRAGSAAQPGKANDLVASIGLIRTIFNRLKGLADAMHADIGVTASMRAVMETLTDRGKMTVPQIASLKDVTRQHIQILVDVLVERGFASTEPNPRHLRSPLIALTKKGRDTFTDMAARESKLIGSLYRNFASDNAAQLRRLLEGLAGKILEISPQSGEKE